LELYRTPKALVGGATPIGAVPASLHPIFKDREEEAAGHGVGAAIEAALAASEFLIVICSPRSAASTWVNREIAWFKTHKDKSRILALIVDGEPGASATLGREAEECFPKTLTRKVGADLQPTEEWEDAPLAADARPEGDGKRGAKLKLAAALLGVGLDALVRRDERRRTIRRRLVTSAAFALAAVLGGLSIFAFNQRDAAVFARNDAVKARDDAEGLIEIILTDLKSDLEGYGTLKSVTAIGNRAIGYYEGQDVKALTPDQLGRRARVLLMLGEADNKRGDLNAALARYETAAATTGEQLARDPENPQRIFDHAQSVFWVGYIAWQRGDREKAKRQFTDYHDYAQRLVAIDPANEDWQAELDYAYSNLGTLAMDAGDAAEAEAWFRKSLAVALKRIETAPDDIEPVLSAGQAYAWLADSQYAQVRINDANITRREEAALYAVALASHAGKRDIEIAQATNYGAQSRILIGLGKLDDAVAMAERAAQIADALLKADPNNSINVDRASMAQSRVGEAHVYVGACDRAQRALTEAIGLARTLINKDNNVSRWNAKLLAHPLLFVARCDADAGRALAAEQRFDEVAALLQPAIASQTSDRINLRRYVMAIAGKARMSPQGGNSWKEVVRLLADNRNRLEPELQTLLAEAYIGLERPDQATPLLKRLKSAGFRHPDLMALEDR
ncbi:MAG: TIR domain-containing protein, partial [Pseudomonadota bacterium]